MSHLDYILSARLAFEKRRKIETELKSPLPLLGTRHLPVGSLQIDPAYSKDNGIFARYTDIESYKHSTPITRFVFSVSKALGNDDFIPQQKEEQGMFWNKHSLVKDRAFDIEEHLKDKGMNATIFQHKYWDESGREGFQIGIALPVQKAVRKKIEGKSFVTLEPNNHAAAYFLSYLIEQNLVSKQDTQGKFTAYVRHLSSKLCGMG